MSPKFQLGHIVSTPGAIEVVTPELMTEYLRRHASGDWGNVCEEDKQSNNAALIEGSRVLSAYPIDPSKPAENGNNTVWLITEADRSATTFLLPSEY